tara:strand:+ start:850 stop:2598 length:1749 start_codon:yes stop_codon:yes gene_type:complete
MTRRLPLLAGLAFLAGFSAFAEAPSAAGEETRAAEADELSEHFRDFVDEAIGEGLLTPTGPLPAAEPVPVPAPAQLFRGRLAPADAAAPVEVDSACITDTVLDTQPFEEFTSYEDFLNWRAEQVVTGGSLTPADVAMAYMSIGLYAEARLQVSGMEDPDSRYIRNLTHLLENGAVSEIELFEQVAACNMFGDIWLSLARLSLLDEQGVNLLDLNLMTYRRLPYRLKIRTASLAVPSLDRMGQSLLAEKLMADFSAEEVRRAPSLSFNRAVLDLNQGGPEREQALRKFLQVPELRSQAAAVLMRHGLPVEADLQEELVGELLENVQRLPRGSDVRASLETMLKGPGEVSDYEMISELAELPAMQDPETHKMLGNQLVARLQKDFGGEDRLASLAAMSAVGENKDILSGNASQDDVTESAARFAGTLGLMTVMTTLSQDIRESESLVSGRAALAFRMQDFASLRDLTQTRPGNPDVMRFAAMGAILMNDRTWLARVGSKVALDTETVVDLIETDAASGNWILPAAVYSAAERITQEEYRPRVDAVLALKFGKAEPRLQRIKLSQIPEHLRQIGSALDAHSQETP